MDGFDLNDCLSHSICVYRVAAIGLRIAVALGGLRDNPDAIAALGDAAQHDPFWGIRAEALRALGRIGGAAAEKSILAAANDDHRQN